MNLVNVLDSLPKPESHFGNLQGVGKMILTWYQHFVISFSISTTNLAPHHNKKPTLARYSFMNDKHITNKQKEETKHKIYKFVKMKSRDFVDSQKLSHFHTHNFFFYLYTERYKSFFKNPTQQSFFLLETERFIFSLNPLSFTLESYLPTVTHPLPKISPPHI